MDELLVHPGAVLRLLLRRAAFVAASWVCRSPVVWCRQQQMLQPDRFLRRGAEAALLASLSQWFIHSERFGAILMRFEPRKSARRRQRFRKVREGVAVVGGRRTRGRRIP